MLLEININQARK